MKKPSPTTGSSGFGPLKSFGARVSALHLIILGLSLVMTLGAWQFSKHQIDNRTWDHFEAIRHDVVALLHDGMLKYEDGLWAGVSAVQSHGGNMSLAEWRSFAKTLQLEEKYPGINGIGIIHYLSDAKFPGYLAVRQSERPDFKVFPDHDAGLYMPISFIEPESINAAAVGLDVAHELNRRTAALAARDTGQAQITGPITLVQDAGETPGFLFYAPFYENQQAATPSDRQDSIAGAVYAPFVVRKLMNGLLARERRDVRFSITDAGQKIYDEHGAADTLNDPDPMFTEQLTLDLYGREWVLDLRTNLAFRVKNSFAQPWVVLIGGLIIEALIIALLVMMSRANARAISYADQVTEALREERAKLAAKNDDLEQFTYIASHDLKTPIRGIGGLTEMIREDLADFLASDDAPADVALNLDRISERVERMGDLTRGIMDFSRVGEFELANEPLVLEDTVEAMISDFGLTPGQLNITSTVPIVTRDPFNLRRVLENLVSNAIKYHDGLKPLRIDITVTRDAERLCFLVQDNGPGIDPQYHKRIFDVFQTLRVADAPESTGIGLAIVKKIVERQGGSVSLVSSVGGGAAFRFDWPDSETFAATRTATASITNSAAA